MTMTDELLSALKRVMRSKGISYKQASESLGLSEASVKRLFSEKSFSLSRFEKLCELAETDFSEMIDLVEAARNQTDQLSVLQEQEIVNDTRLLLVAVSIMNALSFNELLEKYDFPEHELIGLLVKLDRLEIIELLPNNRYRLKISRRFSWLPHGPIETFFIKTLLQEYLSTELQTKQNHMKFVWGMLSRESAQELNSKIKRLLDEYLQLAHRDTKLPVQEKMASSLLVMFREDWQPGMFRKQCKEVE